MALQRRLAEDAGAALSTRPLVLPPDPVIGGCFVAFERGRTGPGGPDDPAWAAAVAWRPAGAGGQPRRGDAALRGVRGNGSPRRARDLEAQVVIAERVGACYRPGLLALREGPILAAAVGALDPPPDVVLVDATGLDHPRRAGLALHLGAVTALATVGVTHRPLVGEGPCPARERGAWAPVSLDGEEVGRWLRTRTGARPVVVHAAWRTDPAGAAAVTLGASTEAARTPVPLAEARRVAREARALARGDG